MLLYVGAEDLSAGLHAWRASVLATEPSPQPLNECTFDHPGLLETAVAEAGAFEERGFRLGRKSPGS